MKHFRKSFLALLALTLFGGAGAWAQGPTNVTQFTTDLIASWEGVNSNLTLEDLQGLGFEAVDASVAAAWTGAPQGEYSVLIYGFNGTDFNFIVFDDNGHAYDPSHSSYTKGYFYNNAANSSTKHFYTGSPAIELTKSGDNEWSLGQTPDYDVELQVEYYPKHALKNIPAGWTVKVNGIDKTAAIDHDSLMIVETDSVTLVPDGNRRRVKSVTLEEEAPATVLITIGSITLDITGCTYWSEIIARNSGVLRVVGGKVKSNQGGYLGKGGASVNSSATYDPSANYSWLH